MADVKNDKHLMNEKEAVAEVFSSEDEELETLPSKDAQSLKANLSGKELIVEHASFPWRDMQITHEGKPAYFADISEFKTGRPDITLHKGGKEGHVVGASRFRFSRSFKVGVGPDDLSMNWIEMKRRGAFKSGVHIEWDGKAYSLRRAKSAEHGSTGLGKLLLSHFKVEEDATGRLVALYVSEVGPKRKMGTLKLMNGISPDLEIVFVLGVTSWLERLSRYKKYAGSNGGGGGGGGG